MRLTKFAILPFAVLLVGCDSVCENVISQTTASPSGSLKAIAFSRNCGATTGFNTQISILRAGEVLPKESGNTFVINGSVLIAMRWSSDSYLQISGVGDASSIKQNPNVFGVAVTYAK